MGVWLWSSKTADLNTIIGDIFPKITHTIAPKIGLHYYYGNHQFNLAYEFGGAIKGLESKKVFTTEHSLDLKTATSHNVRNDPSYFTFGYSYRF